MKKTGWIVLAAAALYAAALVVSWNVGTRTAYAMTEKLLTRAEDVYREMLDDIADSVLCHAGVAFMPFIDGRTQPLSVERMKEIGRLLDVDELNLVRNDGVCIAADRPEGLDYHFASSAATRPFFAVTNPAVPFVTQPFRASTLNANHFRKYLAVRVPDGKGFLELGYDFARLVRVTHARVVSALRNWHIGETGHYDDLTSSSAGLDAPFPADAPDGIVVRAEEKGRTVYCRAFTYAGARTLAVLPAQEYFDTRDAVFVLLAPALALVVAILALCVHIVSSTSERERARRAAEDVTRARDLSVAAAIQLSALPPVDNFRRDIFALTFDTLFHPAREVGGDFYDFYTLDAARLVFVIADVAGKGVPAAMFMMKAKNDIFNALCREPDLVSAVTAANRAICAHNLSELFVTAWIGLINFETGVMEYVNAGHGRPFLRRTDGTVEKVAGKGGLFFGLFPDAKYRSDVLRFSPGDLLFLYTDGVTEAMNPDRQLYGEKRLAARLADVHGTRAAVRAVAEDVAAHGAGAAQSDDLTAIAIEWHGVPTRQTRTFPAEIPSVGAAVAWLREASGLADEAARARLLNAVDEVLTNIVSYSGTDAFTVSVERAPGRVRVVFTDEGRAYNPLLHDDPDVHLPLAERPLGGLGILMMKRLVDGVSYARDGERNVLSLVKYDA